MPRLLTAAIAIVLLAASLPATAQRASLADRVAMLEQRAANAQPNVDLLNQLAQLRTELQSLRAQLEEMQQANEQLRASARVQYLDVDGRLERLEGGRAPGAAATAPAPVASPKPASKPAPAPAAKPAATTASAAPGMSPGDGSALPTGSERVAYDAAFDALKAGRYADSSRLFADFLARHPGGVYAPNALYWLGESYYVTQNYALALEQFEQLLDRFPTHEKAPGAMLKTGLARLGLRQDAAARAAFEETASRYPGTDAARLAADRLRALR